MAGETGPGRAGTGTGQWDEEPATSPLPGTNAFLPDKRVYPHFIHFNFN
jgi:hypothetical protein